MAKFVDNYSDLKELGCDESNNSLIETFNKAANHLQKLLPNIDNQILLTLYGYYKQGSEGTCNIPKPSWYDMRAKAKWEAWNKLGNMPRTEARTLYIETIKKVDPKFEEVLEETRPKEYWVKVSSMQDRELISGAEKTLVDFIKDGSLEEVAKHLKNNEINNVDEEGLSPIHWAADSGCSAIIKMLIESGADVNIQDTDGQTALHYASSCGHADSVKLLLESGGKTDILDNEGYSPIDVASDNNIKELLT